jgi:glucan phosphoethanolaminetransferase (alkaline phosphatase superfamily)
MDEYWIGVLTIWAVCIVLIILVANIKNRSVLNWIGISLLISPVISLVVLIFMSKLSESTSENHHTYSGDANLANDSYKIYLTKKIK